MKVELTKGLSNKFANMAILCAFLVVLIHARPQVAHGSFMWWTRQLLENGVCLMAVPFFFFASGFFLAGHIGEKAWFRRELGKRAKTLLVPFAIWVSLYLAVSMLLNGLSEGVTLKWVARSFGLNPRWYPSLSPLWFVRALFVLICFSPVLWWLVNRFRTGWLALLFLAYGIVCPGPKSIGWPEWVWELSRIGIFSMAGIFYFSLGMACRHGVVCFRFSSFTACLCLMAGLAFVVLQAVLNYNCIGNLSMYAGWIAIPFLLVGCMGLMPDAKWPTWLTANAFSVYLIHKFYYLFDLKVFGIRGELYLLSVASVFVLSLMTAIALRKLLPRFSALAFGGR